MKYRLRLNAFAAFFVGFVVCSMSISTFAEDKVAKIDLAGGKFVMATPETWETVPPKSNMVTYEFKAPKDAKDDTARITIMPASGGVDANVVRWIGQFDGLKKSDAKIDKKEVAGATVHIVDLSGTYNDSMGGGPFAPGKTVKRDNYRMLGAIIETKDAGTIFVKMTGTQAVVEPLVEGFKKSLMEIKSK
ncbi:MAG: hypothetical protein SGI77_04095 [Pirellulaceae bacterium]|nr:hypothetical protein [Pirellulaceae bacterium]